MYKRIKNIFKSHSLVIENYFFMTALQFLSMFFYVLIFPYLIRTIGKEGYGLFVFSLSIITFFTTFVNFGFDLPGVKAIAENQTSKEIQSRIVSTVIIAKVYLFLISILIFIPLIFLIPFLRAHWWIYAFCFIQVPSSILFQSWFFRGIQKMKYVTLIQFTTKLISLFFIFFLVKTRDDLWRFVLISSSATLLGGVIGYFMTIREGIKLIQVQLGEVKSTFKEAIPFFLSTSTGIVKSQLNTILLGSFFTMSDVAVFELANKIITIPLAFLNNISSAFFPKVMKQYNVPYIKKVIKFNLLLGILVIIVVIFIGKYVVIFLGGKEMIEAYPFTIILSLTILPWVLGVAYIQFLFVPNKLYYVVTKNQLVSFVSYLITSFPLIFVFKSIFAVAIASVVAGVSELIYINTIIRRYRLLYD